MFWSIPCCSLCPNINTLGSFFSSSKKFFSYLPNQRKARKERQRQRQRQKEPKKRETQRKEAKKEKRKEDQVKGRKAERQKGKVLILFERRERKQQKWPQKHKKTKQSNKAKQQSKAAKQSNKAKQQSKANPRGKKHQLTSNNKQQLGRERRKERKKREKMALRRLLGEDGFFRNGFPSRALRLMNEMLREEVEGTREVGEGGREWRWMPRCKGEETEKEYVISAELPGVKKEDIEVKVQDNSLSIKGEMKQQHREETKEHFSESVSSGFYQRSFLLPQNADPAAIKARHEDGLLKISIPKLVQDPPNKSVLVPVE